MGLTSKETILDGFRACLKEINGLEAANKMISTELNAYNRVFNILESVEKRRDRCVENSDHIKHTIIETIGQLEAEIKMEQVSVKIPDGMDKVAYKADKN